MFRKSARTVIHLDDAAAIRALDASGLLTHTAAAHQYLIQAWRVGAALPLPDQYRFIERIVIAAGGVAATTAALFAALFADSLNVPVCVVRGYDLPAHADGQATLCIVADPLGDSEEGYAALELADARGTKLLVLTGGGPLQGYAERSGAALWAYPANAPLQRSLYWQIGLYAALLNRLGLVRDPADQVAEAEHVLREAAAAHAPEKPLVQNAAKRLAGQMIARLPLIYGSGFMVPVAAHWRDQIMLTAKAFAVADSLPELNHTTINGLAMLPESIRLATVCLAAPGHDHPRNVVRQELARRMFMAEGIVPDTVTGSGESPLAQALSAALYGDFVSIYLAALYGQDPTPTPALDEVKRRLAATR